MAAKVVPKIGIIVGSQRKPRAGRQIGDFVLDTIQHYHPKVQEGTVSLSMIDLADFNLPLFDEPLPPMAVPSVDQYAHEHTRKWSREISSHDGFIFVTPEYNGSIPASLKNAIDYLSREWKGKPAVIVSYGSRGGTRAASALSIILESIGLKLTETPVNLALKGELMGYAVAGQPLHLDAENGAGVWREEQRDVNKSFGQVVEMLKASETQSPSQ